MPNEVRVRFAPSPTGPLHIGGLRTALYNYLFAKKNNGKFILRIEDTDQGRYVEGSEKHIIDSLNWTGLMVDEGPYRQSERKLLYKKKILELVHKEKAYYAFDTKEELDSTRHELEKKGEVFVYNSENRLDFKNSLSLGKKRTEELLANKTPHVIRFKMPKNSKINFKDLLKGEISVNSSTLDDKVLYKADGSPTYHFANVVDDNDMAISHVIRGEEWLPSLPLHWLIYDSFGWKKPDFLHLPLILKPEGKGKLSKRDGEKFGFPVYPIKWNSDEKVNLGFKEFGFLPEAVINYIAMLGWNPGGEEEVFQLKNLISAFSTGKLNSSGSRFDYKKSVWFNQQHIQLLGNDFLCKALKESLVDNQINPTGEKICDVIPLIKPRLNLLSEIFEAGVYFFRSPLNYNKGLTDSLKTDSSRAIIKEIILSLEQLKSSTKDNVKPVLDKISKNNSIGFGKIMKLVRTGLVGSLKGADVFEIIQFIGKQEVVSRLKALDEILSK